MLKHVTRLFGGPAQKISGQVVKAGSLGIADQLIISSVSFILMVAAARELGPASFGIFSLLFTILLSIHPVQDSLVCSPFNVMGAKEEGKAYRRYLTSVLIIQGALAAVLGMLLVIVSIGVAQFDAAIGRLFLPLAFAAVAWQWQEFIRRVLFAESRFVAVLINNGITHGSRLLLLVILIAGDHVSGERLYMLMGGTWVAGAAIGLWQIRRSLLRGPTFAYTLGIAREHWKFGRWLLVTAGIGYLPWYVMTAVMTSVLSSSAYGAYRAFDQLVNGANVPLQALNNIMRPRLARDALRGTLAVQKTMVPVLVWAGAGFAVFGLALLASQEFLFATVFGEEYVRFAPSMYLMAFTPLAVMHRMVLSMALQAFYITRPMFIGAVLSAGVQSAVSIVAFPIFGLHAAGAPDLLGCSVAVMYLLWKWRKLAGQTPEDPTSARTAEIAPERTVPQPGYVR